MSLAHAMRTGSHVLAVAAPLMRSTAEKHKINVGLAAPDRDEMVYLESIRYNRRPSLRTVVSGQRVPIELTSLGRAYLAIAPAPHKSKLFAHFKKTRAKQWSRLRGEISDAQKQVAHQGYCVASWQPEVVALATPLQLGQQIYVLNVSVTSEGHAAQIAAEMAPLLMELRLKISQALQAT
jgi:DNA-binding IclR family transcriptional regulator